MSSPSTQQQPNASARGTPPKRLTLTPGPRPLHLGTGSFPSPSQCSSPLATPPTTAPLPPRRLGSVSYTARDDFKLGDDREQQGAERPGLVRGGSLREAGARRTKHSSSSSVAYGSPRVSGEGTLERAQREGLERKRASLGASNGAEDQPAVLTLAEKHKDLLHFIAQKESKCVELRAQLAAHEADLLQLKKKWEKIVAKGNDRQARSGPENHAGLGIGRLDATGAVDLVRGILGGLGDFAGSSSTAPSVPATSASSSSVSTPNYGLSPLPSKSPLSQSNAKVPVTAASRAASRGHLAHTPHSSSSSNSTVLSSANTTRLSLSSASSLGGAEQFKESSEPIGEDNDLDAWGPFEGAQTDEPDSISALGLSGVEGENAGAKTKTTVTTPGEGNQSWMSNAVGKKLEELRGTDTYTKSTKRASLLLSDVSTAFTTTLNALAPPTTPSLTRASNTSSPRPSPSIKLTSAKSRPTTKPSPAPIATSALARPVSLLDDDEGTDGAGLGAVLQPSPSLSIKSKVSDTNSTKAGSDAFGEDWNW